MPYDPDAQDYFDRIALIGSISTADKNAYDAFFLELKAQSVWSKLSDVWRPGGDDLASALVKVKAGGGVECTNHNFLEADYSPVRGLKGDGATKKLSTGFIPTSAGLTHSDQSYGVFLLGDLAGSSWTGIALSSNGRMYLGWDLCAYFFAGANPFSVTNLGDGLHILTRDGADTKYYWQGDFMYSSPASGSDAPNVEVELFNYAGSYFVDKTIGGYFAGSNLSAADCAAINNAFESLCGRLAASRRTDILLCFGNSITAPPAGGDASDPDHDYCGLVAAREGMTAFRAGLSGTFLYGNRASYPSSGRSSFLSRTLGSNPSKLIINYATNDVDFGPSEDTPEAYGAQMQRVIQIAKRVHALTGTDMIVADCPYISKPYTSGSDERKDAVIAASDAAATAEGCAIAPVYQAILDAGGDSIMQVRLHPLNPGHQAMADVMIFAESAAPAITAASIDTAGTTLSLTFDQSVTGVSASDYGLTGGTLSAATGSGTAWSMSISPTVYQGAAPTLSYSGTATVNGGGTPMATFSGAAVTNNSTQEAPIGTSHQSSYSLGLGLGFNF